MSAEAVRLLLMAPVVALRWALFAGILLKFVVWRAILQARAPPHGCMACAHLLRQAVLSPARAAAVVAPLTRLTARALLMTLGFAVDVEDGEFAAVLRANASSSFVVANCVSYLDVLLLTAVLGPMALRGPLPAHGAPLAALLCGASSTAAPGLTFPEGAHTAGGCMLPFKPASLAAAAPAKRASPALRAFVLPATVSYSAANSFNAAWTRTGRVATTAHAAQLTAAWMKHARVQLQPLQVMPDDGAAFAEACWIVSAFVTNYRAFGLTRHYLLSPRSFEARCIHGECPERHG